MFGCFFFFLSFFSSLFSLTKGRGCKPAEWKIACSLRSWRSRRMVLFFLSCAASAAPAQMRRRTAGAVAGVSFLVATARAAPISCSAAMWLCSSCAVAAADTAPYRWKRVRSHSSTPDATAKSSSAHRSFKKCSSTLSPSFCCILLPLPPFFLSCLSFTTAARRKKKERTKNAAGTQSLTLLISQL